jgi:hypothetical protein
VTLGSVEPRLIRRGVGLATLFTFVLLLVDLNRDAERCEQECYGTYRTYESGHAWTNYPDSWQWDAQNAIMGAAFVLAAVAFVYRLGSRLQRAVVLAGVSLLLSATWLLWAALSPPTG